MWIVVLYDVSLLVYKYGHYQCISMVTISVYVWLILVYKYGHY